jgi:hypothetical protein
VHNSSVEQEMRFVAHIDILGMSTLVEKNPEEAWGMLSDLVSVKDGVNSYELKFIDLNEHVDMSTMIHAVIFSDTIVLFSKGSSDIELRCIIIAVTEILHKALYKCVPVRAGVAFGKFFFNLEKSMYAGPALIEAYRIGESAKWIGISLADSIHEKVKTLNMKSGISNTVVNWKVPVKNGLENRLVINWPAIFAHDLKVKAPIPVLTFYAAFESAFGPFEKLDDDVKVKYEKTVEFMNEQLARHLT